VCYYGKKFATVKYDDDDDDDDDDDNSRATSWAHRELQFDSRYEQEIFLFSIAFRLALGPTESAV
jgi:hypothetical protein